VERILAVRALPPSSSSTVRNRKGVTALPVTPLSLHVQQKRGQYSRGVLKHDPTGLSKLSKRSQQNAPNAPSGPKNLSRIMHHEEQCHLRESPSLCGTLSRRALNSIKSLML